MGHQACCREFEVLRFLTQQATGLVPLSVSKFDCLRTNFVLPNFRSRGSSDDGYTSKHVWTCSIFEGIWCLILVGFSLEAVCSFGFSLCVVEGLLGCSHNVDAVEALPLPTIISADQKAEFCFVAVADTSEKQVRSPGYPSCFHPVIPSNVCRSRLGCYFIFVRRQEGSCG